MKLTQEEIQQQQHLAKLRSKEMHQTQLRKIRHHLTLPEEQHLKQEDIHNEELETAKPISVMTQK